MGSIFVQFRGISWLRLVVKYINMNSVVPPDTDYVPELHFLPKRLQRESISYEIFAPVYTMNALVMILFLIWKLTYV
jgi:hypothetical protein